MMQITADISTLSREQREAVANFILNFPSIPTEHIDSEDDNAAVIQGFTIYNDESDSDLEPSPDEAFAGPVLVPAPDAPTPAPAGSTLDKSGLPWDERIHASSRTVTADGCWRKKRGVSDALVTQVESELRALMAIPSPPAAPAPPAPPVAAAEPIPPAPPVAPATTDGKTAYVQLISRASAAIVAKQITQDQVNAAVVAAGVPSLPLLGNRLDLVPQVAATIETLIAANAAQQ